MTLQFRAFISINLVMGNQSLYLGLLNAILNACLFLGQELEDLLPARPEFPNVIGDAEEVDLQEFDTTRGSGGGQRREAYNDSSDEESSHHGPGVQCAHQ